MHQSARWLVAVVGASVMGGCSWFGGSSREAEAPAPQPQAQAQAQPAAPAVSADDSFELAPFTIGVSDEETNTAIREFVQRLAGEWEGQVKMRREDGVLSSARASASNRMAKSGNSFASCIDGTVFGRALDAAVVIRTPEHAAASGCLTDGSSKNPILSTHVTVATDELRISCDTTANGKAVCYDQVVKIVDETHYTFELFRAVDNAPAVTVLSLELARLPQGKLTTAAKHFDRSAAVALARQSTVNNHAQAGIDTHD